MKKRKIKKINTIFFISILIISLIGGIFFRMIILNEINKLNSLAESLTPEVNSQLLQISYNLNNFLRYQLIFFMIVIVVLAIVFQIILKYYFVERKNALFDSLTKIFNRRAVMQNFERELLSAKLYKHDLSVAILDLDFFKKYNDTHGHIAGDNLLFEFAKVIMKNVRKTDFYGRIGGEEFLMIFPKTSLSEANELCERLRHEVEHKKFHPEGHFHQSHNVTVSIGLTALKKLEKVSTAELISRADKNLYKAKQQGRNKVIS